MNSVSSIPNTTASLEEQHADFARFQELETKPTQRTKNQRIVYFHKSKQVQLESSTTILGKTFRALGLGERGLNENYETNIAFKIAVESVYSKEIFSYAFPNHDQLVRNRKDFTLDQAKQVFSQLKIVDEFMKDPLIEKVITTQEKKASQQIEYHKALENFGVQSEQYDTLRLEQQKQHKSLVILVDQFLNKKAKEGSLKSLNEVAEARSLLLEQALKKIQEERPRNPLFESISKTIGKMPHLQRDRVILEGSSLKSAPRTFFQRQLQWITGRDINQEEENKAVTTFIYEQINSRYGAVANFAFPKHEYESRLKKGARFSADNIKYILNKAELLEEFLNTGDTLTEINTFLDTQRRVESQGRKKERSRVEVSRQFELFKEATTTASEALTKADNLAMEKLAPNDTILQSLYQQREKACLPWGANAQIDDRLKSLRKMWLEKAWENKIKKEISLGLRIDLLEGTPLPEVPHLSSFIPITRAELVIEEPATTDPTTQKQRNMAPSAPPAEEEDDFEYNQNGSVSV